MYRPLILFFVVCLLVGGAWRGADGKSDTPMVDRTLLATLRAGHPRLIALESDIERVRVMIAQDPLARRWHERLVSEAERILGQPPVEHKLVGIRMLAESRRALDRIYTLGLLYRLDGDRRFADRARRELLTVAAFSDWNPAHFLDTAEMTHAVAIGYDWFYDFLSPQDRGVLRTAIVNLGLKPSLDLYQTHRWWVVAVHNWNPVCNGGMVLGALAVADAEPELATFIVANAIESVRRAVASYAPDGGWAEGPGYWDYATEYTVDLLAGLRTALGTDFGLDAMPGVAETGMFRLHFMGPSGRTFNFADGTDDEPDAPSLFWLARHFDKPLYAWIERQLHRRPTALDLLWFDPRGQGPKVAGMHPDALFRGIDVAFFRSGWEDPNAVFVGFKGGDNQANHSHLDLGTFVLDAEGQRWAVDLGRDDYDLPGYFGRERFTYYRLKTEGHNTLLLNGENQDPHARAPIVAFSSKPDRAFAVMDLTAAYHAQATRVWRGIALLERRHVLVEDEVEADRPVDVLWGMHTSAAVSIVGAHAVLSLQNAFLFARILEPAGASFEVLPVNPPLPQAQTRGVQKLVIRLPARVTKTRIVVVFSSSRDPVPPAFTPEVKSLASWNKD